MKRKTKFILPQQINNIIFVIRLQGFRGSACYERVHQIHQCWIRLTALTHWWVDDSFQMQSSCVCRQWYFSKTVDAGVDTCGLWLHQCFDNINNAIWCRVIVSCSRITDRTVLARMNRSIDWLLDWSIDRFIDRLICWSCCDVKMMMRLVRMLLWQRTWNSWPPQKSTSTTHNNCKIPHRLHTTTAVIMLVTIIVIVILTSYLLLASMFSSMRLMLAGLKRMMMYCCRLLLFVFSMINASVVYTLFDRFCQQLQSCVRACVCVCVCVQVNSDNICTADKGEYSC